MKKTSKTIFDLIDEYCDNDSPKNLKRQFNEVHFWVVVRDKVEEVKKNDKANGGIDLGKLYSQGCTKDL